MGEDIGPLGGVYRVTEGLHAEFGPQRVLDTPLAESGILGTAIGLAMRGYRPVCEIQFDGFIFPAFDQITTQLARMRNRHEGTVTMPIVIRVPYGGHIGSIEHHSESPEAYFAHTPGLRVVSPEQLARRLLDDPGSDRLRRPRPVLRAEEPLLHQGRDQPHRPCRTVAREPGGPPRHRCDGRRPRRDPVDPPARGGTRCRRRDQPRGHRPALALPDRLRALCSTRCARPVAWSSCRRRHRNASVGSEIAATIAEKAFYFLEAPVIRVSGWDTPYPPSKVESMYLPDADRVLEAVDRSLAY